MKRLLYAAGAAALMLGLAGCPNASLQRAAQASENASIIVQGLETAETAAHQNGLIPDSDHQFVQREVLALAQLGKTTDACIATAGSARGAVTCIQTAINAVDTMNAEGALRLQSGKARESFAIAMGSVKVVLQTVETTLNGS